MCPKLVTHDQVYHKEPFRTWATANAQTLLRKHPDVKKHGFYIVTSTFSTTEMSLNAWTNPERKISIGFRSTFVPVGEIAPSSEWYSAESASGWNHYVAKVSLFFVGR
jgi:hypothetical protein